MIVDYIERGPSLVGLPIGPALGQLPGFADPSAPAAPAPTKHQTLDPLAFGIDIGG